jgi:hypothetical protein
MSKGWIKIHRQITEWEWYDEPNTFRIFFHLLVKANHKQNKYRGVMIEPGQIMTGFDRLASETGLTIQKVRTSISRLKSTNEITVNSSTQGTIIQIVNYSKYQVTTDEQQTSNKPITNEQQTDNKPITTNKNDNNEENDKNEKDIKYNALFDLFWSAYDKKRGDKDKLRVKFKTLSEIDIGLIMDYIPRYKISQPEKQYRKDPATFLNNKGWLDELIMPNMVKKKVNAPY